MTGTQTGTKTAFNVKCTDISGFGLSRRAFPKVDDLTSCRDVKDKDTLISYLMSNGEAWLRALAGTVASPPPPPTNIADFKQKYRISKKAGTFDEFMSNVKPEVLTKLGIRGDSAFNLITVKTMEDLEPYQAAVSTDGKILINVHSYGNKDVNKKPQMAFEDIMTFFLAYNIDDKGFDEGTVDIPAAVKKIKYIFRYNIANEATNLAINEAYTVNKWTGVAKKLQLQSVDVQSPIGKALLRRTTAPWAPSCWARTWRLSGPVRSAAWISWQIPAP